jgi:hypothetical protein
MPIKRERINGTTYWIDHRGDLVPLRKIKKTDKSATRLLNRHYKVLKKLSERLQKRRRLLEKDIEKHFEVIRDETGVDASLKGNKTIIDYDQDLKLIVKTPNRIFFDESAIAGVELLEKVFERWSKGAQNEEDLKMMMQDVLDIKTKRTINRSTLYKLYRMDSEDKEFKKAIHILRNAEREEKGKTYLTLMEKPADDRDWKVVPLDFGKMEVDDE